MSSRVRPNSSAVTSAISALPSWLRIAPLGRPVVPEVYISANRSPGSHRLDGRRFARCRVDQRLVVRASSGSVAPKLMKRVLLGMPREFAGRLDQRA